MVSQVGHKVIELLDQNVALMLADRADGVVGHGPDRTTTTRGGLIEAALVAAFGFIRGTYPLNRPRPIPPGRPQSPQAASADQDHPTPNPSVREAPGPISGRLHPH